MLGQEECGLVMFVIFWLFRWLKPFFGYTEVALDLCCLGFSILLERSVEQRIGLLSGGNSSSKR